MTIAASIRELEPRNIGRDLPHPQKRSEIIDCTKYVKLLIELILNVSLQMHTISRGTQLPGLDPNGIRKKFEDPFVSSVLWKLLHVPTSIHTSTSSYDCFCWGGREGNSKMKMEWKLNRTLRLNSAKFLLEEVQKPDAMATSGSNWQLSFFHLYCWINNHRF